MATLPHISVTRLRADAVYRKRASEFELLAESEPVLEVRFRYRVVAQHYRELADREKRSDEVRVAERLKLLRLQCGDVSGNKHWCRHCPREGHPMGRGGAARGGGVNHERMLRQRVVLPRPINERMLFGRIVAS